MKMNWDSDFKAEQLYGVDELTHFLTDTLPYVDIVIIFNDFKYDNHNHPVYGFLSYTEYDRWVLIIPEYYMFWTSKNDDCKSTAEYLIELNSYSNIPSVNCGLCQVEMNIKAKEWRQ